MKTMLLIDGNSILNRAFYGIRSLSTKDGKPTNAIYGLIHVISRELQQLRPTYAAIAFDLREPTFRRALYEPYKANRHGMPEELHMQVEDAKCCAELMGLHRLERAGYEADDLLGTVAAMGENAGDIHTYILSGDRDLLQLISPSVTVLLAGNADTVPYNRDMFFGKYGVEPAQLTEVKGLMGDASDNIPGVSGVGEKTALRLIAAYGNLETVYASLDAPDITRGLRAKLESGKDMAFLSRRLATILRDAPVGCDLGALTYAGMDKPGLRQKFLALEFSGLIRRLGLDRPDSGPDGSDVQDSSDAPEESDAETVAGSMRGPVYRQASPDEILRAAGDRPVAVCLLNGDLYVHAGGDNFGPVPPQQIPALSPFFDGNRTLFCYDSKQLWHTLRRYGLTLRGRPRDLMLYAYVSDAALGTLSPAQLATAYLGTLLPDGTPYAHLLPALAEALAPRITENGAEALLYETELPLALLLAEMEETGFRIDRAGLEGFRDELEHAMHVLAAQIWELAGEEFNIQSPRQLGHILFEKLGLPATRKTKTGYSTDVEVLSRLRYAHPIVAAILDYRQISKLYATYAVGLLKVADQKDRVHTDFKQALTATGRLSSAEPNLQNIPVRTELGREMRRFFIPEDADHVLVDADYSQIELRLLAHMAGDDAMIAGFAHGADIHTATAAAVFGLTPEQVTPALRNRAKAVNFGIVYGIGAYSLGNDIGVPTAQAKAYIDQYFASYPGVAAYLHRTVEEAKRDGYTRTLYGRRRSIPELRAQNKITRSFGERVAMNSPIQGTAADIIKIAMLHVAERLRREKVDARLVMQVHDELILESARSCATQVAQILREEMEGAATLSVPLTVDVRIGETWLK